MCIYIVHRPILHNELIFWLLVIKTVSFKTSSIKSRLLISQFYETQCTQFKKYLLTMLVACSHINTDCNENWHQFLRLSCVRCLFWTNRNCNIYLSIYLIIQLEINPYIGAIIVNGNIYFFWNYSERISEHFYQGFTGVLNIITFLRYVRLFIWY